MGVNTWSTPEKVQSTPESNEINSCRQKLRGGRFAGEVGEPSAKGKRKNKGGPKSPIIILSDSDEEFKADDGGSDGKDNDQEGDEQQGDAVKEEAWANQVQQGGSVEEEEEEEEETTEDTESSSDVDTEEARHRRPVDPFDAYGYDDEGDWVKRPTETHTRTTINTSDITLSLTWMTRKTILMLNGLHDCRRFEFIAISNWK
ncbi:nucleolin-like [Chenopodium quinoa]|uniref:nucleolin-like n=1 Tax=Chenopodium quinoa TaxID=63459 RepID=UPI000B7766D2|nr:nucleolin-like [Chenopodium quinoa]